MGLQAARGRRAGTVASTLVARRRGGGRRGFGSASRRATARAHPSMRRSTYRCRSLPSRRSLAVHVQSGHAQGRTAVGTKSECRRAGNKAVSRGEVARKCSPIIKEPGADPGTAECFTTLAWLGSWVAFASSRKRATRSLPRAPRSFRAGRLMTVAGSPLEVPGNCCCRRLRCACYRPQGMASATSTAANGRG